MRVRHTGTSLNSQRFFGGKSATLTRANDAILIETTHALRNNRNSLFPDFSWDIVVVPYPMAKQTAFGVPRWNSSTQEELWHQIIRTRAAGRALQVDFLFAWISPGGVTL